MPIEIAAASVAIQPDFTGFAAKTQAGVQASASKSAASAARLGGVMTAAVTLPVLGIGAAAIKAFGEFDQAITNSLAIVTDFGDTTRANFEDAAKQVAESTTFSASQAGEAFFFLASAGLSAQSQLDSMPQVAAFAQAGMFDLATATDLATDAQSALGLTMRDDAEQNMTNLTRVTDVLVKANTLANASVEQFSTSLTTKAGTALALVNKDIEEGAAVLAVYADRGIKGQLAGESLSRVLRGLQINASQNTEAFDELGIEVFDSNDNMRNMADIVEDVSDALGPMNDKQKTAALLALGFSARQQDVIKALIGTEDQIREYEVALRDAGGTTQEVADKQLESFNAKLTIAKNRIENAAISLGGTFAPAIAGIADGVADMVELFDRLPEPVKRAATAAALFAAALGPILLISGKFRQARIAAAQLALTEQSLAVAGGRAALAQGELAVATKGVAASSVQANAAIKGGFLAGRGLGTRAFGAVGLAFGGELVGGMIQGIESEEGTTRDVLKDTLANAARGAGIGAAIGTLVPIPGVSTAVGAAIGGAAGGLFGFITSSSVEAAEESVEAFTDTIVAEARSGAQDRAIQSAAGGLNSAFLDAGFSIEAAAEKSAEFAAALTTLIADGMDFEEALDTVRRDFGDELPAAFTEAFTETEAELQSVVPSIFQNVFGEARKVSADEIKKLIVEQQEQLAEFNENLSTLAAAGLGNLVTQLQTQGPAAAGEAAALVKDIETAMEIEGLLGAELTVVDPEVVASAATEDGTIYGTEFGTAAREAISAQFEALTTTSGGALSQLLQPPQVAADAATGVGLAGEGLSQVFIQSVEPVDINSLVERLVAGTIDPARFSELLGTALAGGEDAFSIALTSALSGTGVTDALNEAIAGTIGDVEFAETLTTAGLASTAGYSAGLLENDASVVDAIATLNAGGVLEAEQLADLLNAAAEDGGVQLALGLGEGFSSKFPQITRELRRKATALVNSMNSILGIRSPSEVFAGIGRNIVLGLNEGISSLAVAQPTIPFPGATGGNSEPPVVERNITIIQNNPRTDDENQLAQSALVFDRLIGVA